jgi:hypothetical protein
LLPMSNSPRLATRFFGHADADARPGSRWRSARSGRGERRRARDVYARRHRLARRNSPVCRRAREFFTRRIDRDGGELAFRRSGDARNEIFARLSAWQDWVFQRPNAVGADGALKRYGSGQRPRFDKTRI